MKKLNKNTIITAVTLLAIIASATSIVYYFVIFRPNLDKAYFKPFPLPLFSTKTIKEQTRSEALKECTTDMTYLITTSEIKMNDKEFMENLDYLIKNCMGGKGFE